MLTQGGVCSHNQRFVVFQLSRRKECTVGCAVRQERNWTRNRHKGCEESRPRSVNRILTTHQHQYDPICPGSFWDFQSSKNFQHSPISFKWDHSETRISFQRYNFAKKISNSNFLDIHYSLFQIICWTLWVWSTSLLLVGPGGGGQRLWARHHICSWNPWPGNTFQSLKAFWVYFDCLLSYLAARRRTDIRAFLVRSNSWKLRQLKSFAIVY